MKNSTPIELQVGQDLEISIDFTTEGDQNKIGCSLRQLPSIVRVGDIIYIGESIPCEVRDAVDTAIIVQVKSRGSLRDHMKLYLPQSKLDLNPITDKDEKDIQEFAAEYNFDILAISGLRKEKDIHYVRYLLKQNEKENAHVYVKIDNHEALYNYEKILASADGVIICRTPLATEISADKIFVAQKWMIEKANQAAKPVLIMNEVISSMTSQYTPTRYEVGDLSQSIVDGADGVIL